MATRLPNLIINGFYRHTKSRQVYLLKDIARPVNSSQFPVAVYIQLYHSTFDTVRCGKLVSIPLPMGTAWTREMKDFAEKFEIVDDYLLKLSIERGEEKIINISTF